MPVAKHHLHEFVGAVVAQVVRLVHLAPHVHRLAVVHRGNDVPRRTSFQHQIDSLEPPRQIERLVIGGGPGCPQPQPAGHHAHRHQHSQRIHLHAADAVLHRVSVIAAIHIRHCQPVIEKRRAGTALFQHLGDTWEYSGPVKSVRDCGCRQELASVVQFAPEESRPTPSGA